MLLALAVAPPAPVVQVVDQVAVVRVAGRAKRYRIQVRQAGGSWRAAATGRHRSLRIRLAPGSYRVRAQVRRQHWSRYGQASGWFRVIALVPQPAVSQPAVTPAADPTAPLTPTTPATPVPTVTPTPTSPPVYPGRQIWVDPASGHDDAAGSREAPVRTVTEAWRRIPANVPQAVVIQLLPGSHTVSPTYWENRSGQPIAIVAADGPGTASLTEDINMYRVDNLTIDGLRIHRRGDVFHCEQCRHITVRRVDFDGLGAAHETIKVNQSQHIDILDSSVKGAWDNSIDFVAVQWGTIAGNEISNGGSDLRSVGWCAYVKGGSAFIDVRDNVIHHCGEGGFTAGQGTGFEFMVAPWLTYEAMNVRVVDNLIHDVWGAGLGVNGGFHIRMSGNVLVRVGSRSHTVEFVHGSRSCDGQTAVCQAHHDAGGWGGVGMDGQYIPNRDVWFGNNVIANPAGQPSLWQQVEVGADVVAPAGSNVANPSRADDGLVITNNVFWNRAPDAGYPLDASNRINDLDPLIDPVTLRPAVVPAPVAVPD